MQHEAKEWSLKNMSERGEGRNVRRIQKQTYSKVAFVKRLSLDTSL
jgi:hypothetical protein